MRSKKRHRLAKLTRDSQYFLNLISVLFFLSRTSHEMQDCLTRDRFRSWTRAKDCWLRGAVCSVIFLNWRITQSHSTRCPPLPFTSRRFYQLSHRLTIFVWYLPWWTPVAQAAYGVLQTVLWMEIVFAFDLFKGNTHCSYVLESLQIQCFISIYRNVNLSVVLLLDWFFISFESEIDSYGIQWDYHKLYEQYLLKYLIVLWFMVVEV